MRALRGLFLLGLLFALAVGAWLYRDRILERIGMGPPPREAPTQALSEGAERKLSSLRDGDTRIALSGAELESLLRFAHPGALPAFADSTRIDLEEDRFRVTMRVPLDRVPIDLLGRIARLLPDTTEVRLEGRILPFGERHSAVVVEDLAIADVPLPDRLVPAILERLGRADDDGLPRDAMALPLPPGARAAYVRGDSLVLVSGTAPGS